MSRAIYFAFTYISICLWGALAAAQANAPVCLNGNLDQNQKLIESFEQSGDPLVLAFKSSLKGQSQDNAACACTISSPASNQFNQLDSLAQALTPQIAKMNISPPPPSKFNRECLVAAMKRHPGQAGYTCEYPKKTTKNENPKQTTAIKYGKADEKNGQCVTNQYVDYMKFALDSAYDCISPSNGPLDARSLFKKFNNETGFNNTVAWKGGIGLGQLTTLAVRELTDKQGGGNCTDIIKEIASSDKKSCAPFKHIAQKDLKNMPVISPKNYCAWVSPGDGLARTLMLSTAYNRCVRDRYIIPALKGRGDGELAKNQDVVNILTTISYGRGSIKEAFKLMQKFRLNNANDIKKVMASLPEESPYVRETNNKFHEMYCIKKNLIPGSKECDKKMKLTPEEESGALCAQ